MELCELRAADSDSGHSGRMIQVNPAKSLKDQEENMAKDLTADVYSASNASAALREDFRVLWQNWSAKLLRWSSSIAIFYEHWCSSWIAHVTINSDCGSWAL